MKTFISKCLFNLHAPNNAFITSRAFSFSKSSTLPSHRCFKRTLPFLSCSEQINLSTQDYVCQKRFAHIKAAVLKKFGEKLEIVERPQIAKLKDAEVRVKVHHCAVNVADTLICTGNYDQEPDLPFVPGYEFSGEVLEIGSKVKEFAKGDKVIGLNKDTFSAMATECLSSERDLWKIPQNVALDTAAALVDSYATVLIAARRANLGDGDTVLVTVSAGGLGLAAVDLATNLFNAKVIGACDTEDKTEILREKGAFSTINYSKKDIAKFVMKETEDKGVKVIFDAVGGDIFKDCLKSIAPEGCIAVLGFSSRKIPQILTSQLLPKSCALIGVSLTHYQKNVNETYRNSVQEIIDMYLDEFIEPHVAENFKLKDVNDAIKHVAEGKSPGKVVLDIS